MPYILSPTSFKTFEVPTATYRRLRKATFPLEALSSISVLLGIPPQIKRKQKKENKKQFIEKGSCRRRLLCNVDKLRNGTALLPGF